MGAMLSPRMAAATAAMAPSVARIGVTTPTLPTRKAAAASTRPVTLPAPASSIHPRWSLRSSGTPAMTTKGMLSTRPKIMVQAATDQGPMMRTAREENRELLAKQTAVPRPKMMLITAGL